jgi:hypothetical protein
VRREGMQLREVFRQSASEPDVFHDAVQLFHVTVGSLHRGLAVTCDRTNLPTAKTGDHVILYVKMNVCMYVWNVYKSTFLNRSEPNFAHVSPLVWNRPYGMYVPEILDLFDNLGPFFFGAYC